MKITQEQIEALKQNQVPFGLMSAELQEAMKKINEPKVIGIFDYWGEGEWHQTGRSCLDNSYAYRLRPDYKPESIVECEIKVGSSVKYDKCLVFYKPTFEEPISQACDHPDFIGFKFGDNDNIVHGLPIMYSVAGQTNRGYYTPLEHLESGIAHVHHATAVLFREVGK